jgi:hypothetical protein
MASKIEFDKQNFTVLKQAISKDLAGFLFMYLCLKSNAVKHMKQQNLIGPYDERFGIFGDTQTNGINLYCCYSDFAMETLLFILKEKIEKIVEHPLIENYSYTRLYEKGSELKPHKDRFECGTSTTLNLGGDSWPIFIRTSDNMQPVSVILNPGDLLLYKGVECEHWREPFQGKICGQVFLHYNVINQETLKRKYDGRPMLGITKDGKL